MKLLFYVCMCMTNIVFRGLVQRAMRKTNVTVLLSLLKSAINLQHDPCYISHRILSTLLHYHMK